MYTPVHSPCLPGYIDVAQTILFMLKMAGCFLDRPYIFRSVWCIPLPETYIFWLSLLACKFLKVINISKKKYLFKNSFYKVTSAFSGNLIVQKGVSSDSGSQDCTEDIVIPQALTTGYHPNRHTWPTQHFLLLPSEGSPTHLNNHHQYLYSSKSHKCNLITISLFSTKLFKIISEIRH